MSPRNITCIFPSAGNVHLVKDVGMMADTFARELGWNGRLVCLDRKQSLPYLHDPVDRLQVDFIADDPDYRMFRDPPKTLWPYLRAHASTIDVLQLLHNTRETRQIARLFRRLNPNGKIYLKLDADEGWLRKEITLSHRNLFYRIKEHMLINLFLGKVPDLMTAETDAAMRAVVELYPRSRGKLSILPNGIDERWLCANGFADIRPGRKENLLLTVGRIGHPQKHNEILLDALRRCSVGSWKAAFIGPIESGFQETIDGFFLARPDLRDRVIFTGEIVQRRELYSWYERAKVFCLTSRWESWCFALVDALRFGCHIISTPVQSFQETSDNGRLGTVVETADELADHLQAIFDGRTDPLVNFSSSLEYARKYAWSRICRTLLERIDALPN